MRYLNNRDASDLPGRESMDGSTARQSIVVEEEGRAAIRFVSLCPDMSFLCTNAAPLLATGQLYRSRSIRSGLPGLEPDHGSDGGC